MSTETMTLEQQRTLGGIKADYGADSAYVDDRGYVVMIDGDGYRWEISRSGVRVLVGMR